MTITNEDNMDLMARYDDNYFDLAIVDPPYGIGAGSKKFINRKTANKGGCQIQIGELPYGGFPAAKKIARGG